MNYRKFANFEHILKTTKLLCFYNEFKELMNTNNKNTPFSLRSCL